VLRSTASHLSGQLFGALYDLDIARLSSDMRQVRTWLPVRAFYVTDRTGFVLTDGTDPNPSYGRMMTLPQESQGEVVIDRRQTETEVRFAIRGGDIVVGWGFLTLSERPFRRSLRSIEEGTAAVLQGFRRSLLTLGIGVVLVTVSLGLCASLWLSRTLSRPLSQMSQAAARFAKRDFDEAPVSGTKDEMGELGTALNAMARDLRSQQEALEQQRDLVTLIIETSPVGIVHLDGEGHVRFANHHAEALVGAASRADDWPLLDEEGRALPAGSLPFARVRAIGRSLTDCRYFLNTEEGGLVPLSINVAPLAGMDESFDGAVLTILDIGERRRAERERERLIGELEAKNDELERFAYTVSHDLKSPLISIRGFAGFVAEDVESGQTARVRDDLGRIQAATESMMRLLDRILKLSRAGRVVHAAEDVRLGELVGDAVNLLRGTLDARSVAVKVVDDLPVRRVDRARMLEVFQNLIENAAKFMGNEPAPTIEVGVREDAGEAVFFVRDNGVGIAPEDAPRVFRVFEKLDPRAEGTGLGLALVQRIVVAHGGRVWAESPGLGRGTSICFTLPEPV
jgi:signal transduction histidine kinase